jgi:hypothetical protein
MVLRDIFFLAQPPLLSRRGNGTHPNSFMPLYDRACISYLTSVPVRDQRVLLKKCAAMDA